MTACHKNKIPDVCDTEDARRELKELASRLEGSVTEGLWRRATRGTNRPSRANTSGQSDSQDHLYSRGLTYCPARKAGGPQALRASSVPPCLRVEFLRVLRSSTPTSSSYLPSITRRNRMNRDSRVFGPGLTSSAMFFVRTKSIDAIVREAERHGGLKRVLGPANLVSPWHRRDHRHRHLRAHRPGRGEHAGPAIVISMVIAGVVSALAGLCYAELASTVPDRRVRLHLRVRDARRVRGVDHRLGSGARVRARRCHGRGRMVRLLRQPAERRRHRRSPPS